MQVGRAQLVNSVLSTIHLYWAQVFVLPKVVIDGIEAICRAFLWSGTMHYISTGNVRWDKVCQPKAAGGLGFKKVQMWNIANLARTKQDSLWIRWVVHLKVQDWWRYQPPQDSNWYWKKICEVKERVKALRIQSEISRMSTYCVRRVYERLCGAEIKVGWAVFVWNRLSIPKHRFCMWLVMQGRLKTRDRLMAKGVCGNDGCGLCMQHQETHVHLFF